MFNYDDVGSTFMSLPPNLQNTENECISYAFDRQIGKMNSLARKLTVWSDLNNVNPKYYDYLAMAVRAPYYKSEYADGQKLALIKTAILTRKYAGTIKAIEELLSNTFITATFVPWYEYNGQPYHFKIVTGENPTEDAKSFFEKMLKEVKAARSIIDGVEIDNGVTKTMIYIGAGLQVEKITDIENKGGREHAEI